MRVADDLRRRILQASCARAAAEDRRPRRAVRGEPHADPRSAARARRRGRARRAAASRRAHPRRGRRNSCATSTTCAPPSKACSPSAAASASMTPGSRSSRRRSLPTRRRRRQAQHRAPARRQPREFTTRSMPPRAMPQALRVLGQGRLLIEALRRALRLRRRSRRRGDRAAPCAVAGGRAPRRRARGPPRPGALRRRPRRSFGADGGISRVRLDLRLAVVLPDAPRHADAAVSRV